ncbi:uncharacterized protein LOC143250995 [Tachypleus tridentatus]|uniref:uncharacterized protein LOC143250995 n=1 Tax=Tachypleus tridentatus TaxID=6853 RepID=UPI003FD0154D
MRQVSLVLLAAATFLVAAVAGSYTHYPHYYEQYWRRPYRYDYWPERYEWYPKEWTVYDCTSKYGPPCYRHRDYYHRYWIPCRYGSRYCQDPYYYRYHDNRYYDPYSTLWYSRSYSHEAEEDKKDILENKKDILE